MIKKLTFLSAALMSVAFAAPARAQWVAIGPLGNGGEYWDNQSNDGINCNIGYVVTGVAGTPANPCLNQRPAGWLPFTAPGYDRFNLAPTFSFLGGAVTIVQIAGSGGDVAGEDRAWGVWTSADGGVTKALTNVNPGPFPFVAAFSATTTWGFWVNTTDGVNRFSDIHGQFTRFGKSAGCPDPVICGPIVVGIEDVNVAGGDRDYQDMIATVTFSPSVNVVPEPSTYALMAAGLAALAVVARRRRNV